MFRRDASRIMLASLIVAILTVGVASPAFALTGVWSGKVYADYGPYVGITGTYTTYTSGGIIAAYTSRVQATVYRPNNFYIGWMRLGAKELGPTPDAKSFYYPSDTERWSGYIYPAVPLVGSSARGYSWVPPRKNVYASMYAWMYVGAQMRTYLAGGPVGVVKTGWTPGISL